MQNFLPQISIFAKNGVISGRRLKFFHYAVIVRNFSKIVDF